MRWRTRKITIFVGALVVAGIFAWRMSKPEKPAISISVLGYTYYERGPMARLRITNVGQTPVRWSQFGFDSGRLQVKNGRDWETQRELGTFNWVHPHTVLQPGQMFEFGLGIRGNPSQWRLVYKIQAASLRERATLRLKGKSRERLAWFCNRVLPDRPGSEFELVSDVFDGSNYVQAREMERPAVIDFNEFSGLLK